METKEFVLKAEVFREKNGYMYGRTSVGELFIGYEHDLRFFKDTEENRKRLLSEWEFEKVFA